VEGPLSRKEAGPPAGQRAGADGFRGCPRGQQVQPWAHGPLITVTLCMQSRAPAGPALGRYIQPHLLQARPPPGRHQADRVEKAVPESSAR
jgi:hypothetical protein